MTHEIIFSWQGSNCILATWALLLEGSAIERWISYSTVSYHKVIQVLKSFLLEYDIPTFHVFKYLNILNYFINLEKGKFDKKLPICVQDDFGTSSLFVNIHLTI